MKRRTDVEIIAKVAEIWPDSEHFNFRPTEPYVQITRQDDHIDIEITKPYDPPLLAFAQLNALAEFFDTLNVETASEVNEGGCETCDFGSRYGFVLRVSPGDPFRKIPEPPGE